MRCPYYHICVTRLNDTLCLDQKCELNRLDYTTKEYTKQREPRRALKNQKYSTK